MTTEITVLCIILNSVFFITSMVMMYKVGYRRGYMEGSREATEEAFYDGVKQGIIRGLTGWRSGHCIATVTGNSVI